MPDQAAAIESIKVKLAKPVTPSDACEMLSECYRKGSSDTFLNSMLYKARNPLEPIDDKGRRKFHPLLYSILIVFLLAVGTFVYFTLAH